MRAKVRFLGVAGRRRTRVRIGLAGLAGLMLTPAGLVAPVPAEAYDICADDNSCVHEYIAEQALPLYSNAEINEYFPDIRDGVGHDDLYDHIYELSWVAQSLVTITHFWDSDAGTEDPVTNLIGSFPNAWQKIRSLWSIALGAYARGDKHQAYHYLGHVGHLLGDSTLPTHVHDDMHFPDDDAFEEWMSLPSHVNRDLSDSEKAGLLAAGPVAIPASQPDKLLYLIRTTNQIADFFASDDVDGDAVDSTGWVQPELDAMDAAITSPRTTAQLEDNDEDNDNADGDLGRIRQYSYLRAPRALAALYKLFYDTVTTPITTVTIEKIDELEDHDYACALVCVELSDADWYAKVGIDGRQAQNRGNEITGESVSPNWYFGNTVGIGGTVPVHIEIWDSDGGGTDTISFGGDDDQSDITPGGGLALDLTVDLAKCLSGADNAVTGGVTGKCGVSLQSSGANDDEASRVTFNIRLRPTPRLDTQSSVKNLLGAPIGDIATLVGGASPTGNVEFKLFNDGLCASQVFSTTNAVNSSVATSGFYTPTVVGTYRWTTHYGGDGTNDPADGACNADNESTVIAAFEPPAITRTIGGDLKGPVTIGSGESVLVENARVAGAITVSSGGSLKLVNTQVSGGISVNDPKFLSLCGASVSPSPAGQALSVTNAKVPIRIGDTANSCAGNKFAGTVNLTGNLATMFGANITTRAVTVTNSGPGNTVLKGNTFSTSLNCTGNTPAPTNGGTTNSSPSKLGQCSSL